MRPLAFNELANVELSTPIESSLSKWALTSRALLLTVSELLLKFALNLL